VWSFADQHAEQPVTSIAFICSSDRNKDNLTLQRKKKAQIPDDLNVSDQVTETVTEK
jgi:hypothetical protein